MFTKNDFIMDETAELERRQKRLQAIKDAKYAVYFFDTNENTHMHVYELSYVCPTDINKMKLINTDEELITFVEEQKRMNSNLSISYSTISFMKGV